MRILSIVLWLAIALAFLLRPQALSAMTVVPSWCYLAVGLALAVWKRSRPALFLWLVFALVFTDELRGLIPRPAAGGRCVVAFNCANRDEAVGEALELEADVLLLSELPRKFKGAEGYHAVVGPDTALLSRFPLSDGRQDHNWVSARADTGLQLYSARLVVGVLRADLWNPECWREQAFNRATREESLARADFSDGPVLFGGDTNAPAGDGAFRPLRAAGLRDAFPCAGWGWGNTILGVHRIDQLWTRGLAALRVETRPSAVSDHRMVVAWFRDGAAWPLEKR